MTLTGSGDLGGASAAARRLIVSVGTITPAQAALPAAEGFTFVQVPPASASADGSKVSLQAIITTARASDRSTARDKILQGLEALYFAGVRMEPVNDERIVPGVTNAPELAARASKRIGEALGAGAVTSITSVVPAFSEDFGFFQDQVPGVFCFLGVVCILYVTAMFHFVELSVFPRLCLDAGCACSSVVGRVFSCSAGGHFEPNRSLPYRGVRSVARSTLFGTSSGCRDEI